MTSTTCLFTDRTALESGYLNCSQVASAPARPRLYFFRKKHTKKPIPFAVWQASMWALFTACFTVLSPALAYALAHYDASCSECVALTDAQKAELSALWLRMLCCAALQAAVAALALLLPCRRPSVRSALAVLALAVTIVGHYMHVVTFRFLILADLPRSLFGSMCCGATLSLFAGGQPRLLMGGED